MGKMKELFMQIHYPLGEYDNREYLRNDSLVKDHEYEEYLEMMKSGEVSINHTKIEVKDAGETRIEVHQEAEIHNRETKESES
jgi:hypothetical protein